MGDAVFTLFDDFAVRHARGEHPDVRDYLQRAGSQADELAELLDRFLQAAPPSAPDEATITLVDAWLENRAPLLGLRIQRGIRVDDAATALADELSVEPARLPKLRRYYQRLERGALDSYRVDSRVFEVLGRLMKARPFDLQTWATAQRLAPQQAPSYLRDPALVDVSAPAPEAELWDDVDELFLGPKDGA